MGLQKSDLAELLLTQNASPNEDREEHDERCGQVIHKSIRHFEEHTRDRSRLAHRDIGPFIAPAWCTAFENSLLWIAGCRPSAFIRLTYVLCGFELETHFSQVLHGVETQTMCDLTGQQLSLIDDLQRRTVRGEDSLSAQVAALQGDVIDFPVASLAIKSPDPVVEMNDEIRGALERHEKAMAEVHDEADELRLRKLKELLHVLTPKQGVDFLVASKKLHLSLHEWGKIKDREHTRRKSPS
uniref:DOG1 domain-containing protein n=1 Tax=Kalanchoe fedtschenkoi TaxID=63787 RepID=A0A7N0UBU0_KALFE